MSIERVTVQVVSRALEHPFFAGAWVFHSVDQVVVWIRATEGEGLGLAFTFDPRTAAGVAMLAEALGAVVAGRDPIETGTCHQAMVDAVSFIGYGGPAALAVGAVDIALWDLRARVFGLPLVRLLGGEVQPIPAYVTVGSLDLSISQVVAEAERHLSDGFRAIKVKVGGQRTEAADRVKAVRRAVGPDVALMVDANQTLTEKDALWLSHRLAEERVLWLEEPLPWFDLDGAARLAKSSPVTIAIGESLFSPLPFYEAAARRAGGMLIVNTARVGGITEWTRVAAVAEARGLGVSGHVLPEISAHLVAASPAGRYVEIVPWWPSVFAQPPKLVAGALAIPDSPGLGITLDAQVVGA